MSFSIQTGTVSNFKASESTGWQHVRFDQPFINTPVVFAQCQTRNGMDTPGLRLRNVATDGFEVRMDEVIMNNANSSKLGAMGTLTGSGDHPNAETLGWVAVAM